MRRVTRLDLPADAARDLGEWQNSTDKERATGSLNIGKAWKNARQSPKMEPVVATLKRMAGKRQRCMYCSDSAGTDIEHFWPKSDYPARMFLWLNLLLCCTGCGRDGKGSKFPLDDNGAPLLLDPTAEAPWQFLDFSVTTGNLVPLYDAQGRPAPKGAQTVELLKLDRREAVGAGYLKSFRRIKRAIEDSLAHAAPDAAALIGKLEEADDHGLLGWCFGGNGVNVSPISDLRQNHPSIWVACEQAFGDL